MTDQALIEAAASMLPRAYAPYSRFPVGAALLSASGQLFLGCNVENASYGASICAERGALVQAVSQGVRTFSALAIVSANNMPCVPCGLCRQMLYEFAPDLRIICASQSGQAEVYVLQELLPHAFGSSMLSSHQE